MHLIIGGKYMGKLQYALSLYGADSPVYDLALAPFGDMKAFSSSRIIINLQEGIRSLLASETPVKAFFETHFEVLADKTLVGDEIGSGIVPLDPFERLWRDQTGLVYQYLARHAEVVDRVWAGIPTRLKGEPD